MVQYLEIKNWQIKVGYAVTTAYDTVASEALPAHCCVQAAELLAVMEACKIAEGQ